ncbi:MAG: RES family NAD+ phosphorylase [Deltaproteobacteria bacterium]|nr:RES family NAD+ phosphorylase [Deltaproteobacteria bacterium]
MRVFRLCKAEHAPTAFRGEGAALYPGRWHHAGTRIVYTAESRSLAVLEQLVHLSRNRLPPHFVCFAVDVPDDLEVPALAPAGLPPDWRRQPGPPALRDLGTRWAASRASACLAVPSAIVPGERNLLLNPAHPDFPRLAIGPAEPFALDERLAAGR